MAATLKKRRNMWTQLENEILIECVGELPVNVVEELSSKRAKNAEIWKKVGQAVAVQNVNKSWEQCRQRWKNLRHEYKCAKMTAANEVGCAGGEGHVNYLYKEQLDEVFEKKDSSVGIVDVEISVETHFADTNPAEQSIAAYGSLPHEMEGASSYVSGQQNLRHIKNEICDDASEEAPSEDAPSLHMCSSEQACSSGADIADVYHESGKGQPTAIYSSLSHEKKGTSPSVSGQQNRQHIKTEISEEESDETSSEDNPSLHTSPLQRACRSAADITRVNRKRGVPLKGRQPQASKQEMALQKMLDAQGKILTALQQDNQSFWTRAARERHERDQQLISQLTTVYERSCENLVQGFLSGMQCIMGQTMQFEQPPPPPHHPGVPTVQNHNVQANGVYHHQTSMTSITTATPPDIKTTNYHGGPPIK